MYRKVFVDSGLKTRITSPYHDPSRNGSIQLIGADDCKGSGMEVLIESWASNRINWLQQRPSTVKSKERHVREYIAVCNIACPQDMQVLPLMDWLGEMCSNGQVKTAKNKLSSIRDFAKFLVKSQLLPVNPFVGIKTPRAPRGKPLAPFTYEQYEKLVEYAKHCEKTRWQARANGPLRSTVYQFLYHTGMRRTESRRQEWSDIDLEKRCMVVTDDKARRGDRVALSDEIVEILIEWKKFSTGCMLFEKWPDHNTLKLDMAACGIETSEVVRGCWHRFRKCAIQTRYDVATVDQAKRLHFFSRHADPKVMFDHYLSCDVNSTRDLANLGPKTRKQVRTQLDKQHEGGDDDGADGAFRFPAFATPLTIGLGGSAPPRSNNQTTRVQIPLGSLLGFRAKEAPLRGGSSDPKPKPKSSDSIDLLKEALFQQGRLVALLETVLGDHDEHGHSADRDQS